MGQTLAIAVRAGDSAGQTTVYTGVVGPIAAASAALSATAQPTIAGSAQQGQTLQAAGGSWTQTPSAIGYQWLRCNASGRCVCTGRGSNRLDVCPGRGRCRTFPRRPRPGHRERRGSGGFEQADIRRSLAGGSDSRRARRVPPH